MLKGRLVELEEKEKTYLYEIDDAVKAMMIHFEPIDADLSYIKKIIPLRVQTNANKIARLKPLLDKVREEMERIKTELGENEN